MAFQIKSSGKVIMIDSLSECRETYTQIVRPLSTDSKVADPFYSTFMDLCEDSYKSKIQDKFDKPMLWVGIYVAAASLLCSLLMGADLLHGFRSRKIWFPCKYFTINAASLMVITVAMKLPVDLSNPLPSPVDQLSKSASIFFMCTMMVNSMPSLASMSNKELLANFIAMAILVVTIAANVCIHSNSGAADYTTQGQLPSTPFLGYYYAYYDKYSFSNAKVTIIYVLPLLLLLLILTSSTLAIRSSKCLLQFKYRLCHNKALTEQESGGEAGKSAVEMVTQNVSRHWVMAETGSPQFVMATSPTCSASGVICVSIAILHLFRLTNSGVGLNGRQLFQFKSNYKWSTLVILVVQTIGMLLGTIAPLFRCFAALSFKLSIKWSRNHIKVFRVESYWTQQLCDWKQSHLSFPTAARRSKLLVHLVKKQILNCCIGFQKAVVVVCKVLSLLPIFLVIFYVYCVHGFKLLKRIFFGEPTASNNDITLGCEQEECIKDLRGYVVQLNDEVKLAERTLKGMSKSLNRLIAKAEKQKPQNLLKFLDKSFGFEGIEKFNGNSVSLLLTEEPPNCWSLTVITLASVAMAIPEIPKGKTDSLLRSVDEGLVYVFQVEECLNTTNDSAKFQKAAKNLWVEVEVFRKWFNNNLQGDAFKGKTCEEALKLLRDRANDIINKLNSEEDISFDRVAANLMCHITNEILLSYQDLPVIETEEHLFMQLSATIAKLLCGCFTNLPQVIAMKCYASAIEKREESMKAAAQLAGETKEIINKLQAAGLVMVTRDTS